MLRKKLLRVSVVADWLNVSPKTVRRWALEGRFLYFQPGGPGGAFLIDETSLDEYLDRLAVQLGIDNGIV